MMCKHCIIKEKGTVDFDTYYDKIFKTLHMESEVAMDDDDESWGSDTSSMSASSSDSDMLSDTSTSSTILFE